MDSAQGNSNGATPGGQRPANRRLAGIPAPPARGIQPMSIPLPSPAPRGGGVNRAAVFLAVAVAIVTLPFIIKFQLHRYDGANVKRAWREIDLAGITQTDAIKRFGKPLVTHTFPLSDGAVMGGNPGLKHYYLFTAPDFAERKKTADLVWTFPEYSTIREVLWKLPDSVLTIWFHEPRAQIDLSGEQGQITLPTTEGGEWVAIDNYRIGNDLLKGDPTPPR